MKHLKLLCLLLALFTMPALVASALLEHGKLSRGGSPTEVHMPLLRGPLDMQPSSRPAAPALQIPPSTLDGISLKSADADEAPTIYGSMLLSQKWNTEEAAYGIYSFPATANPTFTYEHDGFLANANGGGTYANSRYYMYYWFEASGVVFTYFRVFDTDTWTALFSERTADYFVSTDMTYDRTTEKIYGCYYNFSTGAYYFGTTDMSNGAVTVLGTYKQPLFAIAADVNGDIYGISADGKLNKVDKSDGSLTPIGATGLTPAYMQSMTFDFRTNKLYWTAVTESVNGLYEVNLTTGKATSIATFDHKEELAGIFIKNTGAASLAPGELTDFSADYDTTTDTDINVSFTLPVTAFDGSALTGTLDWTIRVNDIDIDMGSGTPGSSVNYTVKGTPAGYAVVTAYASNDKGNGPESRLRKWIGRDNPEAVRNLKATVDGQNVTLSWDAPTESEHGGYFDPQALTYKVVRQPGNTPVCNGTTQTTFVDNIDVALLTSFHYEVTAYANNLSSPVAYTSKVLVGEAFNPPYKETFTNPANFDLFTVVDANNDGKTWTYDNNNARGAYSFVNDMDDWLITPPISLSDRNLYQICIAARTFGYTERFEVCVGTAPTPEAMTTVVISPTAFNASSYADFKGDVIPATDGKFYVGIHHISNKERNTLYVNRIELTKLTSVDAPAAPHNFVVTPGEKGTLSATITVDAPTTCIDGTELTEIKSAKLYKGSRILKNFTEVEPGQRLTHTDQACTKGVNEYRIVFTSSVGDGRDATASAFVGPDIPSAANNIRLVEENGLAHLTWEPPTGGVNGGYVDTEGLRYHISAQDFVNGGTKVVAQNLTTREFWDTPSVSGQQGMAAYYVYALNDEGVGYGYRSNVLVMGTPYVLPFKESFAGTDLRYSTWRYENSVGDNTWGTAASGTYPACAPVDNDGGLMTFQPIIEGAVSTIMSGIIDITAADSPVLEFYYFHNRLGGDRVSAMASTDGHDFDVLATVDMAADNGTNGWRKLSVPLTDYRDCKRLQIGIRVEAGNDLANVHFDNIVVRNKPQYDLSVSALSAPTTLSLGTPADFSVAITNTGEKDADSYQVALIRNGEEVATKTGLSLAADQTAYFTFTQTPDRTFGDKVQYTARVTFAGDLDASNDTWPVQTIFVENPPYPTVDDLSASVDAASGSVILEWSAPDIESGARVTESFESYPAFSIFRIGDWLTIDRDKQYTVYVSNADLWPNAGEPQAYIVFNAAEAGLDGDYNDGSQSMFLAHDSKQMLICFAGEENPNDDWLISPMLNGKEQEVTFYVKSLTDYYGAETWELLTSTDQFRENIDSFTKIADGTATEEWTSVTVKVPAGTNYFAIRCTSVNAFGFCIDDISYTPKALELDLKGYHVYCNDVCLTQSPLTATGYVHNDVDYSKTYTYHVVCVYDKGESAYSNAASLDLSSVDEVASSPVSIYTVGTTLHIDGAEGEPYMVVSPDGRTSARGIASAMTAVELQAGVYVVAVGDHRCKVVIR